ncbi:MAG TPA: hypothetical protein VFQ38_09245, partial [Longimicrobiales bacterium]|nr:hypothetical protein [Longimicrobiales bacterium]
DRVIPGGGFPRGRLSVWAPGGGATAVLQAACRGVVGRGERAAWVDGAGMLVGEGWWEGPLLLRPGGVLEGLVCAEELLRSGGFSLVVVTGVGRALAAESVRLSRAAREGGGALVAVAGGVPVAALRVASRIPADGYRWRWGPFGEPAEVLAVRVRAEVEGMGFRARADFELPVMGHEHRLSVESGLVDRRGAGRRPVGGAAGGAGGGGAAGVPGVAAGVGGWAGAAGEAAGGVAAGAAGGGGGG